MSDAAHGTGGATGGATAGAGAEGGGQLGVLLVCFDELKAAAQARRSLDQKLRSGGDALLDTVILQVNAKHKASVYDPRQVVQGTLTAALTWGLFGLVAGGLKSRAIWAILGAVCGGLWAYYTEHLLTKDELASIGTGFPASSSALVTWAATIDPRRLLAATVPCSPAAASVAAIGEDLAARVFAGAAGPVELPRGLAGGALPPGQATLVSMIMLRYPGPGTARQIASRAAPKPKKEAEASPVQVELVIWADRGGRRHAADPAQGAKAWAESNVVSWGLFGLAAGALAGAFGGGGVHSIVSGAVVTGIGWALFGLAAGALYGLWAGRAVSGRRLKRLGPFIAPGTSMIVAWAGKTGDRRHPRPLHHARVTAAGPALQPRRRRPSAGGRLADRADGDLIAAGPSAPPEVATPARPPGGTVLTGGAVTGQGILAAGITVGGFKWTGDFTAIDLIAATTNALNGALLARRPDHYRNFTIVGILLMALLGGIGGGVARDVLLNKIPAALTNPAYILLCLAAGIIGYMVAFAGGQLFREGLFRLK